MGRIDDLNAMDADNYRKARSALKGAAELPEDLLNLYELFYFSLSPLLESQQDVTASFLISGVCQGHLVRGTTSLMRLYSAQMYRETRGAAEAAAIAYMISVDAEALRIFQADKGSDPETRYAARKKFGGGGPFRNKASVPLLRDLAEVYDEGSFMAHTNFVTTGRHVKRTGPERDSTEFIVQDTGGPERTHRELPSCLLWMCISHLAILKASETIFQHLGANLAAFKDEQTRVGAQLMRFEQFISQSISKPQG